MHTKPNAKQWVFGEMVASHSFPFFRYFVLALKSSIIFTLLICNCCTFSVFRFSFLCDSSYRISNFTWHHEFTAFFQSQHKTHEFSGPRIYNEKFFKFHSLEEIVVCFSLFVFFVSIAIFPFS